MVQRTFELIKNSVGGKAPETEKIQIGLVILFLFLNWLSLSNISHLAPPDYYKYFSFSDRLFSGHLDLRNIPPLFPFLLGLSGRLISLISGIFDPFITGTKILSLISSIGVVILNFKLMKKLFNTIAASMSSLLLISSPFFLKFVSTPLTDMMFLFTVICSFYFLLFRKKRASAISVIVAFLTRFEGVLIIISFFINYIKLKIKKNIYFIITSLFSIGIIILFYMNFGKRMIEKLHYIYSNGTYLNFFRYPDRIYSLLMKNILFFYKGDIFSFKGWILFLSLIFLFSYGVRTLFLLNKRFTWSLLFYIAVFTISKGYISGVGNVFNAESQARRMLSLIYLFWLITVIGIVKLIEKIKDIDNKKTKIVIGISVIMLLLLILLSLPFPGTKSVLISIIIVFSVVFISIYRIKISIVKKTAVAVVISILFISIYDSGYRKTYEYVQSLPNRGAYVIAKWINANMERNEKVAIYTSLPMLKYYMKKDVALVRFQTKNEAIYRKRNLLAPFIAKRVKIGKISCIATDYYMNMIDNPWLVAIKLMLFESARWGSDFFKLHKKLFYKGSPVAMIFKVK